MTSVSTVPAQRVPVAGGGDRPVTGGVVVALLTVYLVWGSTYLAIKYTVADLPPLLSMGVRFLLAGALIAGLVLLVRGRPAFRVTGPQLRTAAVCGLFLILGGNGLVAIAEQDVDSGLAALLIAGTPLWVVVLRALLRDRPSAATLLGVLLGSLGGEWGRLDLGAVAASSWIAFGYLVVVGSLAGYSAYVWLLARAPLSLATTYAYVNPAVAVALGALFLDEPLTPSVVGGGAIIIAAVALVISAESRSRRGPARSDAVPAEPA